MSPFDLIQNYDLDGISFDFSGIRAGCSPMRSRTGDGATAPIGTLEARKHRPFVREFAEAARGASVRCSRLELRRWGCMQADPATGTLGSPQAVYQDSESWLRTGDQDYLSPQLYWDFGVSRGDPDFGGLVRRWQAGSGGRHIYAGIGAYKPEVFKQIPRQIDASRDAGNQGQGFFRLESIRTLDMFGGRYDAPALIPPMPWKDSIPPLPPAHLAVAEIALNVFQLEWTRPAPAADGDTARYYVIYRASPGAPRTDIPATIRDVIPASSSYYIDTVKTPTGFTYAYAVTTLDRGQNESTASTVGTGVIRELLALKGRLSNVTSLSASLGAGESSPPLFAFRIAATERVRLEICSRGGGTETVVAVIVDEVREEGTHVVGYTARPLRPGSYTLRLTAGGMQLEQPFRFPR